MAWIRSAPSGGWRAEYRGPDGRKHSKTFPEGKKGAATRWLADQVCAMNRGAWVDPAEGRVTLGVYVERWLPSRKLRPTSRSRLEGIIRNDIAPDLGKVPLSAIRRSDIQALVNALEERGKAPATVRKTYNVLTSIFKSAVADEIIGRSPCIEIELPEADEDDQEMRFLTDEELHRLAGEVPGRYRALIFTGGYLGLRWGEIAGLKRSRVKLRKVEIRETLVELNGHLSAGRPKTKASVRDIALPGFIADVLAEYMSRYPGEYVFTAPEGGPLRRRNFTRRQFDPAVRRVGLAPLRLHDLRHSAAAIAIDTGAPPIQVQRVLGHASINMTLGTYGHLFEEREERLAADLDVRARAAAQDFAASVPPEAVSTVVPLLAAAPEHAL